jgi:hypothetical protein
MLVRIALALLIAWLLGVLGVYAVGSLVHILLLVALTLLLLATARTLETSRRGVSPREGESSEQQPAPRRRVN